MAGPAIPSVLYLFLHMARQTPSHIKRRYPCDPRHRGYIAVTLGTLKSGPNMSLMRIYYVIGQVMHLYPRNRLFIVPVLLKLLYLRRLGLYDAVATHALSDVRHARVSGTLGVDMTVLTGDIVLPGMDDMAELYRLGRGPPNQVGITDLPTHQKGYTGDYNTYD